MGEYVRIHRKRWNSPTLRKLSEDGFKLFDYLCTSPHGNMLGLYVLRQGYATSDLQWSSERFHKAFQEVLMIACSNNSKGLVEVDKENDLVFVKTYLEHNPLTNPNQIKGAQKVLAELPNTYLFSNLKASVEDLAKGFKKGLYEPLIQDLVKRLSKEQLKPLVNTEAVTEAVTEYSHKGARNGLPSPEEISEASIPKIEADLEETCKNLKTQWPKVFAFKNKMLKEKCNPRAILHALCRYAIAKPDVPPWPYCLSILKIENGNFNEREFGKSS